MFLLTPKQIARIKLGLRTSSNGSFEHKLHLFLSVSCARYLPKHLICANHTPACKLLVGQGRAVALSLTNLFIRQTSATGWAQTLDSLCPAEGAAASPVSLPSGVLQKYLEVPSSSGQGIQKVLRWEAEVQGATNVSVRHLHLSMRPLPISLPWVHDLGWQIVKEDSKQIVEEGSSLLGDCVLRATKSPLVFS